MKKTEKTETPKRNYSHESLQIIEDNRLTFWKEYQFHNKLKFMVFVFCLAVIIACLVVKSKLNDDGFSGLLLIPSVIALALAYAYAIFVRKKFDKKLKSYFELYFKCINDYALDGKSFKNVELQKPGKITLEEFNECLLYKDVCEAGSRGLTTFKYNHVDMSVVDCAGNIKDQKRMRPIFVGKMVRAKATYSGEAPIFIYIKGNDRALPPTNLEGIKAQEEDLKLAIYSNNNNYKKVITSEVRKVLEEIKTEKVLVDVAVSIYKSKVFVMLGYDDPLMVLPMQNTFDEQPTEKYKEDIAKVAKLVEVLNK